MKTRLARYLFTHRTLPKRIISRLFPRPILLNLNGVKMFIRLDDWAVGARIAINRVYEKHVTEEIRRFFRPGAVLVDVGANIGYYTLLAAPHLGAAGKIIAFEPSLDSCALLKMSLEKNGFKNVTIHAKAVADIQGIVGFNPDDSNGLINKENPNICAYQVEAVTLDDVLNGEERIDLIKMDVEGAEGLVLKGMEKLIQTHHPLIFTEFRPPALESRSGMNANEFLDRFRNAGYQIHVIHKNQGVNVQPQSNEEILACYEAARPSHLDLKVAPQ